MIAPHWPFVPTPDHPDWDPLMWRDAKNEPGGYRSQKYWDAMVRYTDKMVGKVVNKLDQLNLRENTLVIWTGDNGTFTNIVTPFQGRDYRGGKGSPKDNGTHVGFVASWPGKIKAGSVSDQLVDFSDILPTVCETAGVQVPKSIEVDGVSLLPTFEGKSRDKPYIYCWYERNGVRDKASQHTRDSQYKVYANGKVFDTQNDPDEKKDLSSTIDPNSELGQRIARLRTALQKHMDVTAESDQRQIDLRQSLDKKK